ncbi:MAG: fibrobacter succinogenes major paralogous domain-containing protein [Bacteroidia bacterium]|nr:fibrobacter succinogenes major paralogous domain-containing protein [Bacteroidia bacterium]
MEKNIRFLIYPLFMLLFVILASSFSGNEIPGNDQTSATGTVTDKDGNVYHAVTIGKQVWMAENLKTTQYRNGDPIPYVTVNTSWAALTTGAYCWYNNDATSNKATYGALYNWETVKDKRNIAPAGWHVPTDAEWTILTTFLGGKGLAGGKLKETLTSHWSAPNSDATNSSGFTALPGGYRKNDGAFGNVSYVGGWWSSTEYSKTVAWYRYVDYSSSYVYSCSSYKNSGFSVRCIKD